MLCQAGYNHQIETL